MINCSNLNNIHSVVLDDTIIMFGWLTYLGIGFIFLSKCHDLTPTFIYLIYCWNKHHRKVKLFCQHILVSSRCCFVKDALAGLQILSHPPLLKQASFMQCYTPWQLRCQFLLMVFQGILCFIVLFCSYLLISLLWDLINFFHWQVSHSTDFVDFNPNFLVNSLGKCLIRLWSEMHVWRWCQKQCLSIIFLSYLQPLITGEEMREWGVPTDLVSLWDISRLLFPGYLPSQGLKMYLLWAQELVYHLMWIVIGRRVDENLKGMIKLKVFLICSILSNIKMEVGWSLLFPWFIFIFSVNIIRSYMPVCSWSAPVWPTTSTSLVPEIIILVTKIFAKHLI